MSNRTVKSSSNKFTFLSTPRKIIIILLIGFVLSAATAFLLGRFYTSLLVQRVNSFVQSVDPADIVQLKNTTLPDSQVPYQKVKAKLSSLKQVYTETRFVYIMDKENDKVYFLADSEPSTSPVYSARHSYYPEATPALKALFDNKKSFVEGPVHDAYGTWFSALTPIVDANGTVVAIMGVDVPITSYASVILGIGSSPLLIAIAVSTAVAFYDAGRRRRLEALRFQIELSAIASHELQEPLEGIRWGEEQLLLGGLNESQQKLLQVMRESTLRLQKSIEDILQLADIGNEQPTTMSMVSLDVVPVVQETIKAQTEAAQAEDIQLQFDTSWPVHIITHGNDSQLRRVFSNLIASSINYASHGHKLLFIYSQKDRQHLIQIRHEGAHVPKKQLDHVFDGFYNPSNKFRNTISGAGMGLFLARSIIEQHGGRLWLESTDDINVTVYITLPIVIAAANSLASTSSHPA